MTWRDTDVLPATTVHRLLGSLVLEGIHPDPLKVQVNLRLAVDTSQLQGYKVQYSIEDIDEGSDERNVDHPVSQDDLDYQKNVRVVTDDVEDDGDPLNAGNAVDGGGSVRVVHGVRETIGAGVEGVETDRTAGGVARSIELAGDNTPLTEIDREAVPPVANPDVPIGSDEVAVSHEEFSDADLEHVEDVAADSHEDNVEDGDEGPAPDNSIVRPE